MPRTRTTTKPHETGYSYLVPTGEYFFSTLPNDYETVQDGGPGYHQDQYFYVEKIRRTGGVYNGNNASWQHVNAGVTRYSFGNHQDPNRVLHSTDEQIAAKMLAASNPSAPITDVPVLAAELGDIPKLLFIGGRNLIEKGASLNLKYNFEIKPLVQDTFSILQFVSNVKGRLKELQELQKSGVKKAKAAVEHRTREIHQNGILLNTAGGVFITADERIKYDSRKWGYSTWSVDGSFPITSQGMLSAAFRSAYGLHIDFATVWNVIPWTWLIDWFANIGAILDANRNIVGASSGPCYICHEERSQLDNVNVVVETPGIRYTPFRCEMITKRRSLASPFLSASIPMVSAGQFSILASLNILNRR